MSKKNRLFLVLLWITFLTISESGFAGKTKGSESSFSSSEERYQGDLFRLRKSEKTVETKRSPDVAAVAKINRNYLPYAQIGGTRFFNVDESVWGTGVDFFIPLWQLSPAHLVFTDLRFYDRTGKPFEGNIHLGYRHLSEENNAMYGIYGAFDRKRSINSHYFNQLTFGIETWYKSWFIGANYYQPIGQKSKNTRVEDSLESKYINNIGNILVTPNYFGEKTAGGGDAEVGYEFFPGITGYAGGYYFKANNMSTICGPKMRLSYDYSLDNGQRILKIFDQLGFDAGMQHDQRGSVGFLSLNARVGLFPNNGNKLRGVARHMVDLVRRDVDIVVQEGFIGVGTPKPAVHGVKVVKIIRWNDSYGDDGRELETTLQKFKSSNHVVIVTKSGDTISEKNQSIIKEYNAETVSEGQSIRAFSPFSGRGLPVIAKPAEVPPQTAPADQTMEQILEPSKPAEAPPQTAPADLEPPMPEVLKDPVTAIDEPTPQPPCVTFDCLNEAAKSDKARAHEMLNDLFSQSSDKARAFVEKFGDSIGKKYGKDSFQRSPLYQAMRSGLNRPEANDLEARMNAKRFD